MSFHTRARGGGIWAPGGIAQAGGALLVATGNNFGAQTWHDGEAVLRLQPDLGRPLSKQDYFAPADWRKLDARDLDLGGVNPMPLADPGGGAAKLVVALGKNGDAYLLDADELGGIGEPVASAHVSRAPIITAPAAYGAGGETYVVFVAAPEDCPQGQRGDLAGLRLERGAKPGLRVAWCAQAQGRGSPMVTTTGGGRDSIVWIAGAEGDDELHGFDAETGKVVFDGRGTKMDGVPRFQTPVAASARLYVAGRGRVYAFAW